MGRSSIVPRDLQVPTPGWVITWLTVYSNMCNNLLTVSAPDMESQCRVRRRTEAKEKWKYGSEANNDPGLRYGTEIAKATCNKDRHFERESALGNLEQIHK